MQMLRDTSVRDLIALMLICRRNRLRRRIAGNLGAWKRAVKRIEIFIEHYEGMGHCYSFCTPLTAYSGGKLILYYTPWHQCRVTIPYNCTVLGKQKTQALVHTEDEAWGLNQIKHVENFVWSFFKSLEYLFIVGEPPYRLIHFSESSDHEWKTEQIQLWEGMHPKGGFTALSGFKLLGFRLSAL